MNSILKKLKAPLVVAVIFAVLYIAWRILKLPPREELIEIARFYFQQYGLIILLLSAFIEGLIFFGMYYPGSLVIFLGVIFAGRDLGQVMLAVAVVIIGLFSAYVVNFFIGRYGWYKLFLKLGFRQELSRAEKRLARYGWRAIMMTYWQPNIASLSATASGILRIPFKRFAVYSAIAAVIWNMFWGVVVYLWGESAVSIIGLRTILIFLSAWIIYQLFFYKEEVI